MNEPIVKLRAYQNAVTTTVQRGDPIVFLLGLLCFLGIAALLLCFVLPVSSSPRLPVSESPRLDSLPAIPIVTNRAPDGRFIRPHCPLCHAATATHCEAWRCANGHRFETADEPLQ